MGKNKGQRNQNQHNQQPQDTEFASESIDGANSYSNNKKNAQNRNKR
ncbi:hypothetical protein [Cohnella fermenti]|nr:hypothetical protein [Cohnella fermenti]